MNFDLLIHALAGIGAGAIVVQAVRWYGRLIQAVRERAIAKDWRSAVIEVHVKDGPMLFRRDAFGAAADYRHRGDGVEFYVIDIRRPLVLVVRGPR